MQAIVWILRLIVVVAGLSAMKSFTSIRRRIQRAGTGM